MSNVSEKKHEHKGRSSREMLDARKILNDIGLKSGDQFLDAGCGDGYFSEAAAEVVGPGGRVYAFDVDGDGIGLKTVEGFAGILLGSAADVTPLGIQNHWHAGVLGVDMGDQLFQLVFGPVRGEIGNLRLE